ncbi:MAG: hypothetical protein WBQ94_08905 [Terracidiphilus sp.]
MRTIAELNMLLREQITLPDGLKLTTEEFRDGWNLVKKSDAGRLRKKIRTRGWNFIGTADGCLRSGVGDTSQQAIGGALRLALEQMSDHFNAAEVDHIELTKYPWFFLARVRINPYRIQQEAELAVTDEVRSDPSPSRPNRLTQPTEGLFSRTMPMLKGMLVSL